MSYEWVEDPDVQFPTPGGPGISYQMSVKEIVEPGLPSNGFIKTLSVPEDSYAADIYLLYKQIYEQQGREVSELVKTVGVMNTTHYVLTETEAEGS